MIVFSGSSSAGDTLNISDSAGYNWTALNPVTSQSGEGTARSWYAFSAGTASIKISVTSNANWQDILFDEFSGVSQTNPLDKVGQKTGSGTSTSAALVPSTNNELVWAGSLGTITGVGSGYGKGADDSSEDWTEHKILSGGSGATQTATFGSSGSYICLAASFKPAVSAGSPPAISAFTASPSTINAGQSSTLTWTSSGGTSATLNGTSVAVSGNRVVSPSATTTYTLIVQNAAGSDSAQAKVTVNTAGGSGSSGQKISFWPSSTVPGTQQTTDTSPVTLGIEFYSDVPGSVTAVRFYKGSSNTGTHVGNLWTSNGTNLATVTFTGETASGWQQANFSSPVSIAANTTYVISYLAPKGYYADDKSYSWASVNATPLHVSGSSPGVFSYGSSASFPDGAWNASNYWVDLVFVPSGSSSTPPSTYSISGKVSGSAATLTLSGAASGQTKTDASGNYAFSGLANGSYLVAPSQSGYSFSPSTAAKTVSGANISGVNFTASADPPPVQHTVSLSWTASTSPNITGYNIYRATDSGGPYTKVNASLDAGTSYADTSVSSGGTYYYVTTAVNSSNVESGYSNQAEAAVPNP